eukprot:m51a1_g10928 hypothetical protein (357) ;mRNA; r:129646-130815
MRTLLSYAAIAAAVLLCDAASAKFSLFGTVPVANSTAQLRVGFQTFNPKAYVTATSGHTVKCAIKYHQVGQSGDKELQLASAPDGTRTVYTAAIDMSSFMYTTTVFAFELSCTDTTDSSSAKSAWTLGFQRCSEVPATECVSDSVNSSFPCHYCKSECIKRESGTTAGCSVCGNGVLDPGEQCDRTHALCDNSTCMCRSGSTSSGSGACTAPAQYLETLFEAGCAGDDCTSAMASRVQRCVNAAQTRVSYRCGNTKCYFSKLWTKSVFKLEYVAGPLLPAEVVQGFNQTCLESVVLPQVLNNTVGWVNPAATLCLNDGKKETCDKYIYKSAAPTTSAPVLRHVLLAVIALMCATSM